MLFLLNDEIRKYNENLLPLVRRITKNKLSFSSSVFEKGYIYYLYVKAEGGYLANFPIKLDNGIMPKQIIAHNISDSENIFEIAFTVEDYYDSIDFLIDDEEFLIDIIRFEKVTNQLENHVANALQIFGREGLKFFINERIYELDCSQKYIYEDSIVPVQYLGLLPINGNFDYAVIYEKD